MPATTVTSKGQITLPKAIREALGVQAGDRVVFVRQPDGSIVVEAETLDVRRLQGRLRRYVSRPVSLDEMEDAIAECAAERDRNRDAP